MGHLNNESERTGLVLVQMINLEKLIHKTSKSKRAEAKRDHLGEEADLVA